MNANTKQKEAYCHLVVSDPDKKANKENNVSAEVLGTESNQQEIPADLTASRVSEYLKNVSMLFDETCNNYRRQMAKQVEKNKHHEIALEETYKSELSKLQDIIKKTEATNEEKIISLKQSQAKEIEESQDVIQSLKNKILDLSEENKNALDEKQKSTKSLERYIQEILQENKQLQQEISQSNKTIKLLAEEKLLSSKKLEKAKTILTSEKEKRLNAERNAKAQIKRVKSVLKYYFSEQFS